MNDYLAELSGGLSTSTVRGHLWQARKRGLLGGSPGKKGGALSKEAEEILGRIDADSEESFLEALDNARPET